MTKAFLAIKYYDDMRNKETIESIVNTLKKANIDVFAFAKNIQNYEPCGFTPQETMEMCFSEIEKSDIFIIEASEPSIGIGVEAGWAYCHDIPIYLIAKKDNEVSNSIKGIAKKVIFYNVVTADVFYNIFCLPKIFFKPISKCLLKYLNFIMFKFFGNFSHFLKC